MTDHDETDRLRTAIRQYVSDMKALLKYPPSQSRDHAAASLLQKLEKSGRS